jgi:hypothetical protein
MMTVYLVYEAIANGLIDFDTVVPISQFTYNYSRTPGETNVPLTFHRNYTVDMLLDVIIVMSAGGACAALAELIAGSTRNFHRLMNAKAEEWGIDAVFFSVSGGVTHTQLTPRAMAEITRRSVQDFPDMLEKTALDYVNWFGRVIPATNHLLGVYEGIDGFKTGTHPGTRANFAGTAQRGDIRIITVTMGSSSARRFPDTAILLDHGFAVMEEHWRTVIEARMVAPRISTVLVNGEEFELELFTIGGENYFSLRDIAYALRGTMAEFSVGQDDDSGAILIMSGTEYMPVGMEMSSRGTERKLPEPIVGNVFIDGEEAGVSAFDIEGESYFRLPDLGGALGFEVVWRWAGESRAVNIIAGVVEPPPDLSEALPPIIIPIVPAMPVASAEPEMTGGANEAAPIPIPIVLGVVGGLCIIGGCSMGIKKWRNRRRWL